VGAQAAHALSTRSQQGLQALIEGRPPSKVFCEADELDARWGLMDKGGKVGCGGPIVDHREAYRNILGKKRLKCL